jgi:hypothetical protein
VAAKVPKSPKKEKKKEELEVRCNIFIDHVHAHSTTQAAPAAEAPKSEATPAEAPAETAPAAEEPAKEAAAEPVKETETAAAAEAPAAEPAAAEAPAKEELKEEKVCFDLLARVTSINQSPIYRRRLKARRRKSKSVGASLLASMNSSSRSPRLMLLLPLRLMSSRLRLNSRPQWIPLRTRQRRLHPLPPSSRTSQLKLLLPPLSLPLPHKALYVTGPSNFYERPS